MSDSSKPVLILGGGINGAALARELLLNRVPVVVVDTADICSGASAYSSRLIHGGLRYLEYGEFDLVRESLRERRRLLRLAPHLVRPLRLFIPCRNRLGGWWPTLTRFLLRRSAATTKPRGMWLVRAGLWFYDRYARDKQLPQHAAHRIGDEQTPTVDPEAFCGLCSYSDAQAISPERLVVAMFQDATALADSCGCEFRLWTYHTARFAAADGEVELCSVMDDGQIVDSVTPSLIVNATGAWVDRTLQQLDIRETRLMGGTRGSHFVTYQEPLQSALCGSAVYVEAADGRPVFVLPFGEGVLVGTTDVPFEGDPAKARATDEELDYLVETVNRTFPQVQLSRDDLAMHYSGVRPLPDARGVTAAAVTRRHAIKRHSDCRLPLFSLIGGKLTTCRALAEETTAVVLASLGRGAQNSSRERPFPGGEDYPEDAESLQHAWNRIADQHGASPSQVAALWYLFGTRTGEVFTAASGPPWINASDTDLPIAVIRWIIQNEWVRTLDDLIERRLMLLYKSQLSARCLKDCAQLLVEESLLRSEDLEVQIAATIRRLDQQFGKRVVS